MTRVLPARLDVRLCATSQTREALPGTRDARVRDIAREPRNGQSALDHSVAVKPGTRIGIDYDAGDLVILRCHEAGEFDDSPNEEIFHGFVVDWADLKPEYRAALLEAGMVSPEGGIL